MTGTERRLDKIEARLNLSEHPEDEREVEYKVAFLRAILRAEERVLSHRQDDDQLYEDLQERAARIRREIEELGYPATVDDATISRDRALMEEMASSRPPIENLAERLNEARVRAEQRRAARLRANHGRI